MLARPLIKLVPLKAKAVLALTDTQRSLGAKKHEAVFRNHVGLRQPNSQSAQVQQASGTATTLSLGQSVRSAP